MFSLLNNIKHWGVEFLDSYSNRLCPACKSKYSNKFDKFLCDDCYSKSILSFDNSKKIIDSDFDEILSECKNPAWHPRIYFAKVYDELTRTLIKSFKYYSPHYSKNLAQILLEYWLLNASAILSNTDETDNSKNAGHLFVDEKFLYKLNFKKKIDLYITGVPMHFKKLKERGFNQAKLLAKDFSELLKEQKNKRSFFYQYQDLEGLMLTELNKVNYLDNLVLRKKNTEGLYDKNKEERKKILEDAFIVNEFAVSKFKEKENNNSNIKVLLVIDDITTTGATFLNIFKKISNRCHDCFDDVIFLSLTGSQ